MLRTFLHWLTQRANPSLCTVEFTAGGVSCRSGTPPPGCLADVADVAGAFHLTRGTLDVVRRDGRLQLRFSPDVPVDCHQRFRNVLGAQLAARNAW